MAQQTQKQEHDNLHRDGQRHPFPLWVRWFIVLFVPLVVIVGTILWIIQGAQAIIPIAVLTALGLLIAFTQLIPWLFPSIKHEHSMSSSPQPISNSQLMSSSSPHSQPSPPSVQTHSPDINGVPQSFTLTSIQLPEQACAGYLAYPFQNQVVNGHTGNLYATYRFINCKEKEPVEPSLAFLFGTDMLSSQHTPPAQVRACHLLLESPLQAPAGHPR
jgi:hypothetical protein